MILCSILIKSKKTSKKNVQEKNKHQKYKKIFKKQSIMMSKSTIYNKIYIYYKLNMKVCLKIIIAKQKNMLKFKIKTNNNKTI